MSIQIIVDSCCDTTSALRHAMEFQIAPLTVSAGQSSFVDDGDLPIAALLAAMKSTKEPASSACPSPRKLCCFNAPATTEHCGNTFFQTVRQL